MSNYQEAHTFDILVAQKNHLLNADFDLNVFIRMISYDFLYKLACATQIINLYYFEGYYFYKIKGLYTHFSVIHKSINSF